MPPPVTMQIQPLMSKSLEIVRALWSAIVVVVIDGDWSFEFVVLVYEEKVTDVKKYRN